MAFQPVPVSRRFGTQIAHAFEHPLGLIKRLWKKEGGAGTQPPTMEAYTEAANKCLSSATAFLEHARLFLEAKRAYDLWQREIEIARVRKEIDALKLVIPLLVDEATDCQFECITDGSYVSIPCGKPAVAQCSECGAAICSDWCPGESFCEACRDCRVTNSSIKKPVRNERSSFPYSPMPTRQA